MDHSRTWDERPTITLADEWKPLRARRRFLDEAATRLANGHIAVLMVFPSDAHSIDYTANRVRCRCDAS
jgi:hypothetical protein